jgi:BirA family biotin operon repressor/biotin-[acetyl-CoA-carboxylase] ligase
MAINSLPHKCGVPNPSGTPHLCGGGTAPGNRPGPEGTLVELVPASDGSPVLSTLEDWQLHEYRAVTSTNLIAANLRPWTAVRADVQTNGRGRFQRTWISDLGGLWLSAVVPVSKYPLMRGALPLATGLAIYNALRELGVSGLRLRWPNDVLVNNRKLAGLLIDQFVPDLAVVGIGLNVSNEPEKLDAKLRDSIARLADLVPEPPKLRQLADLILRHLRIVLTDLDRNGAAPLFVQVNELWSSPRRVELDLDGVVRQGLFTGIDEAGRLVLSNSKGMLSFHDAHQVRHLTEI